MRKINSQLVTAEIQKPDSVNYRNYPLIMLRGTALMTRLREERRFPERTVRSAFAKNKICQSGCSKNAAVEELCPSMKLKFFLILYP